MEDILLVKNLKKHYRDIRAVDDISFSVKKGEITSILGPNGAGKTTTVEIIEGLRKADAGDIYLFGKKVSHIDATIKKSMGVQLQTTAFFEYLTVKETIELFAGLYGVTVDSRKVIEEFSLIDKTRSKVKELSGGQLQRLALAVAVVNDPEIIFLDEPTTGLDPQARRNVWDIVLKLKEKGKTIILTTHYMEEAEKLSDHVYIMDHGKIVASGTVEELVKSLGMESFVEFSTTQSEKALALLEGDFKIKAVTRETLSIPTTNVEQTLHVLFSKSHENGFNVDNVIIRRPNLEDVFLHITGRSLRD